MFVQALPTTQPMQQSPLWLDKQCEKIVLSVFRQMSMGHLVLTLPTGQVLSFGKSSSNISAEIVIERYDFYRKVILNGHIGFAEAYMAGDWETPNIETVISWALLNVENSPILEGSQNKSFWINTLGILNQMGQWLKQNSLRQSRKNISDHYDLSNTFFSLFLDESMTYSSAKFDHPTQPLAQAQQNKYRAICQKLRLQPSDHVLEIGTGWGGFALFAAQNYGCTVTTITISKEQYKLANERIEAAGYSDKVTVLLKDYREITGKFDKIASIEMIEAVGEAYLDTFIAQCTRCLKKEGLLALQMIVCPDSRYALLKNNVDFIQKHIFPGSLLPSIGRINQALNRTGTLSLVELDDLGLSYARTLRCWHRNFMSQQEAIGSLGFDATFIRKWEYYFLYCAAAFQMRNITLVQALYSHPNNLTLNQTVPQTEALLC